MDQQLFQNHFKVFIAMSGDKKVFCGQGNVASKMLLKENSS